MKKQKIRFKIDYTYLGGDYVELPLSVIIQKILPELRKESEKWADKNLDNSVSVIDVHSFLDYLHQNYAKQKK